MITADVSGSLNSNLDFNALTLTVPPNSLQAGDVIDFHILYELTKPTTGATTFNFWLKNTVGSKIATVSYALTTQTFTSNSVQFMGKLSIKSIGAGGTCAVGAYKANYSGGGDTSAFQSGTLSINTTISNTFTLGCHSSWPSTLSSVIAKAGGIKLW